MLGRLLGCLTVLAAASLVGASAGWGTRGIVGADQQVYVVPAAGGKVRQLTQGDLAAHSPSWAPVGRRIAYVRGAQMSIVDLRAGSTKTIVFGRLVSDAPPAWSPNGRQIAFTALSSPEGRASIDVVASTGSSAKTLASTPWGTGGDQRGPVWSPDGKLLAFCLQGPRIGDPGGTKRSGNLDLATVTTSGARKRLTSAPGNEYDPHWSPDGHSILYASDSALRVTPRNGGPSHLVRLASVVGASWSPDGKLIAFTGSRPGESRVHLYIVRPDGSGLRRLTGEVTPDAPAWSPNSRLIAFATYGTGIDVVAPDGRGRRTVTSIADTDFGHLAWSPDGRTIAFDARKQPPGS